jgi:hypothetical protein
MGANNSVDLAGLRREFSKQARAFRTTQAFAAFFWYYLDDLGRTKSLRVSPANSTLDPHRAMVVCEGVFDHWPLVKVSANFTREGNQLKLVQLRFEKIETEN